MINESIIKRIAAGFINITIYIQTTSRHGSPLQRVLSLSKERGAGGEETPFQTSTELHSLKIKRVCLKNSK